MIPIASEHVYRTSIEAARRCVRAFPSLMHIERSALSYASADAMLE